MPRDNRINVKWMFAAFTRAMRMRYATKEWNVEQFNDFLLCILRQRPEYRAQLVRKIREKDYQTANVWTHLDIYNPTETAKMHREGQRLDIKLAADFQQESALPRLVKPADCDIFVIDNSMKLKFAEHIMKETSTKLGDQYNIIVGLDAEWMPYVTSTR